MKGSRLSSYFTLSEMKSRGLGNSTWLHSKRGYQLNDKDSFLDLPKDKKWMFLAEYSDKTMMPNKIGYDMGHMSSIDYISESIYTDVYINNSYNGIYHVSQKIEESDQPKRLDPDDISFILAFIIP